jgi:hypothetical protein
MNKVFIVTETVIRGDEYLRFEIVGVYDTYELAELHANDLKIRAHVINNQRKLYTYDVEAHELKCAIKCAKRFENN